MEQHQIDRIAEELFAVVPPLNRMISETRREGGDQPSASQLRLLAELLQGPQSMSALARQQHVSPQAVCDLVQAMLERGWLTRLPHDQDRRRQLLRITETGKTVFTTAHDQTLRQLTARLRDLSDTELYVLAAALPTLQRMLSQGAQLTRSSGVRLKKGTPDGA